jgi:hypothetical protein
MGEDARWCGSLRCVRRDAKAGERLALLFEDADYVD